MMRRIVILLALIGVAAGGAAEAQRTADQRPVVVASKPFA
jgi:hypothetical protein